MISEDSSTLVHILLMSGSRRELGDDRVWPRAPVAHRVTAFVVGGTTGRVRGPSVRCVGDSLRSVENAPDLADICALLGPASEDGISGTPAGAKMRQSDLASWDFGGERFGGHGVRSSGDGEQTRAVLPTCCCVLPHRHNRTDEHSSRRGGLRLVEGPLRQVSCTGARRAQRYRIGGRLRRWRRLNHPATIT